ncbi:hypothetical protein FGO68_gene2189 [Halteria grandinella]|uniref:Uncharacterized protein n=1 Tax=Halteria grandinella TaxID=5974 RepID=A0A8J8NMQ3_HALGN|nr:hypothetical protein FGO68_gene2189 [Halteria grandinella]
MDSFSDEEPALVLDLGSFTIKSGFSGDDTPKCFTPTLFGIPKDPGQMIGMDQKDYYAGNDVRAKQHLLNVSEPIRQGVIVDFDMLEKLLEDVISNDLKYTFEGQKILLTEQPGQNTKEVRDKLAQMMFETYKAEAVYFGNQQVLSLYANAKSTGTVIDVGHGKTHIVPIYEGFAIPHSIISLPIGGETLTKALYDSLKGKPQIDHTFTFDLEMSRTIKEAYCHNPLDFDNYLKQISDGLIPTERNYKLPGTHREISIKSESLIFPPERYFSPISHNGKEFDGLHRLLTESILKCDSDIRLQLFRNIVLSGGGSMLEGFKERAKKEINAVCSSIVGPEIFSPADRKFSAWLGGSILSNITSFKQLWVTKEQWAQLGSAIIYRNCF